MHTNSFDSATADHSDQSDCQPPAMSQAQPQPPPAIAYAYYQQSAPYDAHASARQGHEDEEKRAIDVQPGVSASAPSSSSSASAAAAAPAPPLLPVGAVPFNGGVLFGPNLFSNSYRVPGPEGRNWVYYDNSCPMPPASTDGPPTLTQQWHQLTRWQKIFVGGLFMFWLLQWLVHPVVALWMPLLFVPTYILWRLWRSHYQSVELGLLVRFYSVAFAPGALVVMLVESVVTVLFLFLCFQSYIAQLITGATPSDVGGGGHAKGHAKSDGSDGIPDGMEFLRFAESPALFVFLFLLSYVSAGVVEESLKYYCARDVKRRRPSYRVLYGYGLYAAAAALGFSSIENIGYVLSGAVGKGGDGSVIGVLVNVLGRVCISTPLHVMCGYLIGLQVFRRDVLAEPLSIFKVMGWSVFFHGTFDFGSLCAQTAAVAAASAASATPVPARRQPKPVTILDPFAHHRCLSAFPFLCAVPSPASLSLVRFVLHHGAAASLVERAGRQRGQLRADGVRGGQRHGRTGVRHLAHATAHSQPGRGAAAGTARGGRTRGRRTRAAAFAARRRGGRGRPRARAAFCEWFRATAAAGCG